jgi:hypothetical protein
MKMIPRPAADEYAPYYSRYIDLVPKGDIFKVLDKQIDTMGDLFGGMNERQSLRRYEPGKWSPKEILGHIVDTERLFVYRGLTFARGDQTELPGMDEDAWVAGAEFDGLAMDDLLEEFTLVRRSTVVLLHTFSDEVLARRGVASGNAMSVRAVPFILAGHTAHHMGVIRERYLD